MTLCSDCGGTIQADGYCDDCGAAPAAASAAAETPTADPGDLAGSTCSDCGGTIQADGYCDDCGAAPSADPSGVAASAGSSAATAGGTGTRRIVVERLIERPSTRQVSTTRRSRIGEGVVRIQPAAGPDPSEVVKSDPQVPESHRFCPNCDSQVGRARAGKPGLSKGFCPNCGTPFDFSPQLAPGDLVAGQYQVDGAMAHGGMGWIFLARDRNVSDRPCVLKGVIALQDEAAREAAEAERREMAELSHHPNIVSIHNYVNDDGGADDGAAGGYIVMEYLGGQSLKEVRDTNSGPLPPHEAISYLLAVLPAFSFMHSQGRVFCDFKPDNVMHVGDEVKLIDLGGVRRIDDHHSAIFGTPGYQAPEVPRTGTTIASDLYTIGRSLAVLILDWPEWQRADREQLPRREDHPLLVGHDTLWRFLQRACHPDPDQRFADADEMADQLRGVLHQVVATVDGTTQPYTSSRWGTPQSTLDVLTWSGLPRPILPAHPDRPDRIAGVAQGETAIQIAERMFADPSRSGDLSWADIATVALAHCQTDPTSAARFLAQLDADGEDAESERSVISAARTYLDGVISLANDDVDEAAAQFERAYAAAPGEAACALARAVVAEQQGNRAQFRAQLAGRSTPATPTAPAASPLDESAAALYNEAGALYDQVVTAHPSWVGAVAGLARTLDSLGRHRDAGQVFLAVPTAHPLRAEALVRACAHMSGDYLTGRTEAHVAFDGKVAAAASTHLEPTEPRNRPAAEAELAVALYVAALTALDRGEPVDLPSVGLPPDAKDLALAAEQAMLELADVTGERGRRHKLLDLAARTRPWSVQ